VQDVGPRLELGCAGLVDHVAVVEDVGAGLLAYGGLAEADADRLAFACDAAVADVLLA